MTSIPSSKSMTASRPNVTLFNDTSKTAKIIWFILVLHWAVDVIEVIYYIKKRAAINIDINVSKYVFSSPQGQCIYIHGLWGDENIFAVLLCHFAMGLTHFYKTTVFLHFYLQFLSRVNTLTHDIDIANLSVCRSDCSWRSGIRWKRLNIV